MTEQAPPDLDKITERIQKLLNKARGTANEAEAAAFMSRAMEELARHNLDMASVESAVTGSAKREKAAQAGGQYTYQRDLWKAVAELNFCMYLTGHVPVRVRVGGATGWDRTSWRRQHSVVGRTVNTRTSIVMATYLEDVTNRLCREQLEVRSGAGTTPGDLNSQFYSSWAVEYRVGMADRLIEKVQERRAQHLRAENKARRAAEKAADGVSTAMGLSLVVYKSQEEDANIDFLHGEGTAAQWAADRAERAAERAADEVEFARWAKANPKDARDMSKRRKKWVDLGYTFSRSSHSSASSEKRRGAGYYAGYEAAEKVSIDPQAGSANTKRLK